MRTLAPLLLAAAVALAAGGEGAERGSRFVSVPVFVDPKGAPLAAYQLEFRAEGASARIVGVEGGEHPAFREPPYYDPAALARENRIILAAFSTAGDLPRERTRVATLQLMVEGGGEPRFAVRADVTATIEGKAIQAAVAAGKGGGADAPK